MARYHITQDGLPGLCKAQEGNCPLGGNEEHYSDKLDALKAAEVKLQEENDHLATLKKNVIYHVGDSGKVEECPYREGYCKVKAFGLYPTVHNGNKNVVAGAAQGLQKAHFTERKRPGRPLGKMPEALQKVQENPVAQEDALTGEARDLLQGGPSRLGPRVKGIHKVTPGDSIIVRPPGSSRRVAYNTLRDALKAGWDYNDIKVETYSASHCSHTLVTPDWDDESHWDVSTVRGGLTQMSRGGLEAQWAWEEARKKNSMPVSRRVTHC